MTESFNRHVPEPVKRIKPLTPATPGPNPAKPAAPLAKGGAQRAEGQERDDKPREIGGPSGPEPTRYGDWEINGRCIDF